MSYGWNRDGGAPPPSAADLASSFLNSVGQELHGSNDNHYGHESQGRYGEEMGYHGGNEEYRSRREGGGDRDRDRERRHGSRDCYHDNHAVVTEIVDVEDLEIDVNVLLVDIMVEVTETIETIVDHVEEVLVHVVQVVVVIVMMRM
ncbi:unnamed protein product [Mucor hiemalis]